MSLLGSGAGQSWEGLGSKVRVVSWWRLLTWWQLVITHDATEWLERRGLLPMGPRLAPPPAVSHLRVFLFSALISSSLPSNPLTPPSTPPLSYYPLLERAFNSPSGSLNFYL